VGVAAAFEAERPERVHAVLAASEPDDARSAAQAIGLRRVAVVSRDATQSVVEGVLAARETSPGAPIALTGGSALIVAVRSALRERGVRDVKTKPYWVPGKAGLD
jgi:hypothetical protein